MLTHGSFEIPVGTGQDERIDAMTSDAALVSFNLTLLKGLQGIGSAPAIDYDEYRRWIETRSQL
jgi:hypothetical protein